MIKRKQKSLILSGVGMLTAIFFAVFWLFIGNRSTVYAEGNESISFLTNPPTAIQGSYTTDGSKVTSFTCNTGNDLVILSQLDPALYETATININPTGGTNFSIYSSITNSGTNYKYIPLGNASHPFKGTFGASGSSAVTMYADNVIFSYLDTSASITASMQIMRIPSTLDGHANTDCDTARLFADVITGSGSVTYNISYDSYNTEDDISFGGIIGKTTGASTVTLNITDNGSGHEEIKSTENVGYFIGELCSNSTLVIDSFTGTIPNIKSTKAHAGGLVGQTKNNSSVIVNTSLVISNSIRAEADWMDAGGLIGNAYNLNLTIADGKTITVDGATIYGGGCVGGIIGRYNINSNSYFRTIDTAKIIVTGSDLKSNYKDASAQDYEGAGTMLFSKKSDGTGGMIGMLNINSGIVQFTITDTNSLANRNPVITEKYTSVGNNYGGLIGRYLCANLKSSLEIKDITVKSHTASDCSIYGGLIGTMEGINNSREYVKINNVKVVTQMNAAGTFGGLVATCPNGGSFMLDIGSVEVTTYKNDLSTKTFTASNYGGGLVGYISSGVIRLSGVTDLTNAKPAETYNKYGQLIGFTGTVASAVTGKDAKGNDIKTQYYNAGQYNTVVYSEGSGADSTWTLKRCDSIMVSDIGRTNTIIRNVSTKMNGLFTFSETDHTVTVSAFSTTLSTVKDYAAYYVYYTCGNQSVTNGPLRFASTSTNVWENTAITIGANLDLTGTGLLGLTTEDDIKGSSLTITGNNHKITLAIGEPYGYRGSSMIAGTTKNGVVTYPSGSGQIYNHLFVGFLGAASGTTTINNLSFDGNVYYGVSPNEGSYMCVGLVAASSGGTINYNNVDVSTNYIGDVGNTANGLYILVGSYFAASVIWDATNLKYIYKGSSVSLSLDNCEWTSTMYANKNANCHFTGGIAAYIGLGSSLSIQSSTIGGKIYQDGSLEYNAVGGLLAVTEGTKNASSITINIENVILSDTISYTSTKNGGGLLGYTWFSSIVNITGLTVKNASLDASTGSLAGGLLYKLAGCCFVDNSSGSGIVFDSNVSIKCKSTADNPFGLFISSIANTYYHRYYLGYDHNGTDLGVAYVEIGKSSYVINTNAVTLNLASSPSVYDEIVGYSIYSLDTDGKNGVVSISTTDGQLINSTGSNMYQKQMSSTSNNSKTRYYYNLDQCRESDMDLTTITTPQALMVWSVCHQMQESKTAYPYLVATYKENPTITGTIDLSGYSYYANNLKNSITLQNATITFDYSRVANAAISPTNSNGQHYYMNVGLFRNATNSSTVEVKLNKVTFKGNTGSVNGYCGILASGTIMGTATNKLEKITLNTIVLDGASIYGVTSSTTYAPLLINKIGNYSQLSVSDVTTTTTYNNGSATKIAATSLLGIIGNTTDGTSISLTFSTISLDSRKNSGTLDLNYHTYNSIFTRATLMESFAYTDTGSCGGQYTFNSTDSKITYGYELSNSETNGGRNQEGQYSYFDTEDIVTYNGTVADVGDGFTILYLRYIYTQEDKVNFYFEIDINQSVFNMVSGCGTFGDPYKISDGRTLETLAKFLNDQFPANWVICVDKNVLSAQKSSANHLETATSTHEYYKLVGSTWYKATQSGDEYVATTTTGDLTKIKLYLRNAYYGIVNDIVLGQSSSYKGLGDGDVLNTATDGTFSGVITGYKGENHDKIPTIEIHAPTDSQKNYGGLIAFGSGCVVRNLNVVYPATYEKAGETITNTITIDASNMVNNYAPANQVFFGGVIGYALGGDNLIENVEVSIASNVIEVTGDYSHLSAVGGFVGLCGGNYSTGSGNTNGGGVVFKTACLINKNDDGKSQSFEINGSALSDDNYYWNTYVGRVLDGFAVSDGIDLNNSNKNYEILNLAKNSLTLTVSSTDSTHHIITVKSAYDLWFLDQLVESGAAGRSSSSNGFKGNSYNRGKARISDYSKIGTDSTIPTDEYAWGGKDEAKIGQRYSYLLYYYSKTNTSLNALVYMSGTNSSYKIIVNNDITFVGFNGIFDGIGTNYTDRNVDPFCRTIALSEVDGNKHKITLNTTIKENVHDVWNIKYMGLFAESYSLPSLTIHDLTISGTMSIVYDDDLINHDSSIGAVVGNTGISDKIIIFENVTVDGFNTSGARNAAGILGSTQYWVTKDDPYFSYAAPTSKNATYGKAGVPAFINCTVQNSNIYGCFVAGGLLGASTRKVTLDGEIKVINTHIKMTLPFADIIYDRINDMGQAKDPLAGAGGVIGYLKQDFVMSEGTSCTIKECDIKGVQQSFYTDSGIGGIIGKSCYYTQNFDNITIEDTTIGLDIDDSATCRYTKAVATNGKKYFFGLAVGGIVGTRQYSYKADGTLVTKTEMNNYTATRVTLVNGSFMGAVEGKSRGGTYNNISINNCNLSSFGLYSNRGVTACGGLIGELETTAVLMTNISMTGTKVLSEYEAGGLIASQVTALTNTYENISIVNSVIATTGIPDSSQKFIDGSGSSTANAATLTLKNGASDIYKIGSLGYFYASSKEVITENATNVLIKNSLLGYILDGTTTHSNLTTEDAIELTYTNENIGVYGTESGSGTKSFIAYKDAEFKNSNSYKAGYDGLLIGYNSNASTVLNILGLSVIGDYVPIEMNGKDNVGLSNCYYLYSDYANGANEITSENATENDNAPYVVTSPRVNLPGLTIYGNGVYISNDECVGKTIITDINNYNSTNTKYNLIYRNAITAAQTEGLKDVIKAYWTAEADSEFNYHFAAGEQFSNFSLLEIEDDTVLDSYLKAYITILTNNTTTNYSIGVQTYVWNETQFEAASRDSIIYNTKLGQFRGVAGAYDNGKGQITIVTVSYEMNGWTYSMDIPVLVKKVLYFDFFASTASGTSYVDSAYTSNVNATLSEFGNAITIRLEYVYERAISDWITQLNNGESLYYYFNRIGVLLTETNSLPAGTSFILLDTQASGRMDYYYVSSDAVTNRLSFDSFTDFEYHYICDMLNITVEEDASGIFIKLDNSTGATFRVSNNGDYEYYRVATEEEIEAGATLYSIASYSPSNTTTLNGISYLHEVYYLTIFASSNSGFINNLVGFGGTKIDDGSNCASHLKNQTSSSYQYVVNSNYTASENRYIIGNFFTQSETVIADNPVESEIFMSDDPTSTVTVSVKATNTISLTDDGTGGTNLFKLYTTSNSKLYQQFSIGAKNYDQVGSESSHYIPAGTKIRVVYKITGVTDTVNLTYEYTVNTSTSYYVIDNYEIFKYFSNKTGGEDLNSIKVEANIFLTFNRASFTEQFMEKPGSGSVSSLFGTAFDVKSNIAMSQSALVGSTSTVSKTHDKHYYRSSVSLVSLSYYAYDSEMATDTSGDVSQLGLNGKNNDNEDVTSVPIHTAAVYDASTLTNTNAKYLSIGITLQVKNDSGGYVDVSNAVSGTALNQYITDLVIYDNSVSTTTNNSTLNYQVELTDRDKGMYVQDALMIQLDFNIVTGSALEAINGYFSNYKVILTIDLLDQSGNSLNASATDYIIYSNIMLNSDIMQAK